MRILSILFICCIFFFIIFCVLNFIFYFCKIIDKGSFFVNSLILFYVLISILSWYLAFDDFLNYDPLWDDFNFYLTRDINYIIFIIKKYLFSLFFNFYFLFINYNLLTIVVLIYIFKTF